ncbi:MAG: hypothetical protein ACOWWO_07320 [Peptococcaceae bacterium]
MGLQALESGEMTEEYYSIIEGADQAVEKIDYGYPRSRLPYFTADVSQKCDQETAHDTWLSRCTGVNQT